MKLWRLCGLAIREVVFSHEYGSIRKQLMERDAQHCGDVEGAVHSRGVSAPECAERVFFRQRALALALCTFQTATLPGSEVLKSCMSMENALLASSYGVFIFYFSRFFRYPEGHRGWLYE